MTSAPPADPRDAGRWRRHPRVWVRAVPRGWLVLGPADDAPVLLAGTAAALWEALEPPCTRDELSERLAHRFGVDAPVVAGDLEAPLTDLAVRGLVHVGADPDAAHTGDADPGDAGRRGAFPS